MLYKATIRNIYYDKLIKCKMGVTYKYMKKTKTAYSINYNNN